MIEILIFCWAQTIEKGRTLIFWLTVKNNEFCHQETGTYHLSVGYQEVNVSWILISHMAEVRY